MFDTYKKKIIDFYQDTNRMPGYNEIMSLCGFKSKNSVYKLINKLVEHNVVHKDSQGRLTPTNFINEVKMLGSVQAGFPTHAEEQDLDTLSLDDYMIGNREATYLLTVKGDSMIDAGIHEGDLVIVERSETAKVGEIVVAEVDGDWTMKYLRKKNGKTYLEPANERFSDIYPENSLKIGGIVKGVLRKYKS